MVTSRNDLLSRLFSVLLGKCYILISIWHSLFVGAQNAKTLISYGFLKHFGAVVRCRNGVFFSFFHWFCKSFLVISIWPLSSAWMFFSPSKRKSCLRIVFCIIFELWARLEKVWVWVGDPGNEGFLIKLLLFKVGWGGPRNLIKRSPQKCGALAEGFLIQLLLFGLGWGGPQKSKKRSPPTCGSW